RSHFESMGIWHAADPRGGDGSGWVGHYLDHLVRGTREESIANNPLLGINIGNDMPMAMLSSNVTVPAVNSIEDFGLRFQGGSEFDRELEKQIIIELQEMQKSGNAAQDYFARQATDAIISADEIRSVAGKYKPDARYQGGLGNRLRLTAQLISGNFGTRVFYAQTGGFDTHANQLQQHENLLRGVADNVKAFFTDLKKKGIANKVTLMCFSEFGRRVEQNANNGTDHGAAGPMFVCGPEVAGGFYGKPANMDDLERGDLKFNTDFRRIYASMLGGWLNAESSSVLKGDFEPMPLLASMKPATPPSDEIEKAPTTQPAA
ncbi:MAG: DUF1501 domain-containing protein, partial [Planctomycetota bacterium]